ncbi:MAG: NUDIX hydrolase [Dongiaceae bacterium]
MTDGDPTLTAKLVRKIPDGDTHEREVCVHCGFVNYENPKIVVGSVCSWGERILMCRRAINPRKGHWTLPAGYLELHETPESGAAREAGEEAGARIEIDTLLAVYTIPRLSQVQLIYRARLSDDRIAAGPESQAVELFAFEDIPWDDLAFPSVRWALHHFAQSRGQHGFPPFTNPPGETGNLETGGL